MNELNPNELNPNPYAPGVVQKKEILSEVETVRKQYLSHEASVKSIGVLWVVGGLFTFVSGAAFSAALVSPPPGGSTVAIAGIAAVLILLGITQFVVAIGIRKLYPWSRIPATFLSVCSLFAVPMGTLVGTYMLYLLLSKKGTMVFSPEYKEVIAQTPHMKYKTSPVVWIALGLLVVVFVFMVAFFGRR